MWLVVAPAPPIVDLQLHVISPPLKRAASEYHVEAKIE